MGQVTIYLDNETERRMRGAAKSAGLSQSKWIARLIQERTRETWPEAFVRLAGAWKDMPTAEEVREGVPEDAEREPL
ncbi:MAG: CopG family transcriptional regulator [Deltaproteobacteria bacterium]|nr:CopG family transcriptional regulator [Deltaproteobacteria bacterium]